MTQELHIIAFFTDGSQPLGERVDELVSDLVALRLDHLHAFSLVMKPDIPEREVRDRVEPIVKAILDAQQRKKTA